VVELLPRSSWLGKSFLWALAGPGADADFCPLCPGVAEAGFWSQQRTLGLIERWVCEKLKL
jgi:hypothetical protein